jgi:RNA polymerase sigma-70 factor (ECF subfamily)
LPPRQRAILILRDVLDWQASEVAALMDTTVSAVKSALHRARSTLADYGYVSDPEPVQPLDDAVQTRLDLYVRAWEMADINALLRLLTEEATFSMPPIPAWYRGHDSIRRLAAMTLFSGQAEGRWRLLPTRANRQVAFGLYRKGGTQSVYQSYGIQVVTFECGLIADITTFRIPNLFQYFNLPLTLDLTQAQTGILKG